MEVSPRIWSIVETKTCRFTDKQIIGPLKQAETTIPNSDLEVDQSEDVAAQ